MKKAGQILDVFSQEEMDTFIYSLNTFDTHEDTLKRTGNDCRAVDENHPAHDWFVTEIFNRVSDLFDEELYLQFGMSLNETKPWSIHTDAYHTKPFPDRKPGVSMVIPYSLDNDRNHLKDGYTIVFNEEVLNDEDLNDYPDSSDRPDSAMHIFDEHLSHNNPDWVKHLTVEGVYPWTFGSLIYWDSLMMHDSNNFLARGRSSKQAIVIHTYRK